jgi:3-methyladenine DNA glycosylase AlkD
MEHWLAEIRNEFKKNSNPVQAKRAKAYLLNQFEFFGVMTPKRRSISKVFYTSHPIQSHNELTKIVKRCFDQPERELHYFGLEWLGFSSALWNKQTLPLIEWIITHQSWWDSVDATNSHVIGLFFKKFPKYIPKYTQKWNQSNNIWLQRMSILFQLSYKKETDTHLLSKYIENCIDNPDFFIRKAIGWSLRAYAYHNPKWVKAFVKSHPQLSTLSVREALKHQK